MSSKLNKQVEMGIDTSVASHHKPRRFDYTPPEEFKKLLNKLQRTNLPLTVTVVLLTHLVIVITAAAGWYSLLFLPTWLWPVILPMCWIVIAVCQRGLEVFVHEGSHFNWTRWRRLNDYLTNLLAAVPMMSSVGSFRLTHDPHHWWTGCGNDPERARFERLGLASLSRTSAPALLKSFARLVVGYWVGWWQIIGTSPLTIIHFLIWHALVYILPLTVLFGWASGLRLWLLFWLLPMMVTLTFVRFVGESDEHVYEDEPGLLDNTVSNYHAWAKWIFHPFNDGFHMIHHRFLAIPWHNLRRSHELLMQLDPYIYGELHLRRDCLLCDPHRAKL